jgi:hypothetical protein
MIFYDKVTLKIYEIQQKAKEIPFEHLSWVERPNFINHSIKV